MRDSAGGFWEQVSTRITEECAEKTPLPSILVLPSWSVYGGCCLEVFLRPKINPEKEQ